MEEGEVSVGGEVVRDEGTECSSSPPELLLLLELSMVLWFAALAKTLSAFDKLLFITPPMLLALMFTLPTMRSSKLVEATEARIVSAAL